MRITVPCTILPFVLGSLVACHGTTAPEPADNACGSSASFAAVPSARPTGALGSRVAGLAGRPFGIRIARTGVVYATQQDDNSVARLTLTSSLPGAPLGVGADPGDVVFNDAGTRAYVSNFNDGTVHVLDVVGGARLRALRAGADNAYRLALSPDGTRLYVTSRELLVAVDPEGVRESLSIGIGSGGSPLQGLVITRSGGSLIASALDGTVRRVDACTLATQASASLGQAGTQDLALSPDGAEVYVANENGWIDVLDAGTLRLLRHFVIAGARPFGLAITGDGSRMYIASAQTGRVVIADAHTGEIYQTLSVNGQPRRIAFDAAGTTAVVSNEGNWIDVIR